MTDADAEVLAWVIAIDLTSWLDWLFRATS